MHTFLIAWMPGPLECAAIAVVALLIFGRRLPDVARSMGKSIVEFKKGLKDVKGEVDAAAREEDTPQKSLPPNNNAPDTPSQS